MLKQKLIKIVFIDKHILMHNDIPLNIIDRNKAHLINLPFILGFTVLLRRKHSLSQL